MKKSILVLLIFLCCATSTTIRSIPEGAIIKQYDEVIGVTPYDYWDRSLSFSSKIFTLQIDGFKDKEITIKKDQVYIHRIFWIPIVSWPWLFGYKTEYYFELEKNEVAPTAASVKINEGKLVGLIKSVDTANNEIIVSSVVIGHLVNIGDRLYSVFDGAKINMEVTFPMQTIAKCKVVEKKNITKLKVGDTVYK